MSKSCGHKTCDCDTQGKEYCSSHCATAAAMEEETTHCECHHTACHHSTEPKPIPPDA
jgi:hypothetical protein